MTQEILNERQETRDKRQETRTNYQYLIIGGGMTAAAAVDGIREAEPAKPGA